VLLDVLVFGVPELGAKGRTHVFVAIILISGAMPWLLCLLLLEV
jgi:hypothetical protein